MRGLDYVQDVEKKRTDMEFDINFTHTHIFGESFTPNNV